MRCAVTLRGIKPPTQWYDEGEECMEGFTYQKIISFRDVLKTAHKPQGGAYVPADFLMFWMQGNVKYFHGELQTPGN